MMAGGPAPPEASRPVLLVLSETDPVARGVGERWGTPPSTGATVDGAAVRELEPGILVVRRPGHHIEDERVDRRLPPPLREAVPTVIFPSVHRSRENIPGLTVHPLGNPGPRAELGGRPRVLTPTDPRRMAATLRRLAEGAAGLGVGASYEATHHGPELALPAFFAEVGSGPESAPSEGAIRLLADTLRVDEPDGSDRVALAAGGGHYAPHFTDLTVRRRWAFGHILSRHALGEIDSATARSAFEESPGAAGVVYARAADADLPVLRGLGPRLRDQDAPRRSDDAGSPTRPSPTASGT